MISPSQFMRIRYAGATLLLMGLAASAWYSPAEEQAQVLRGAAPSATDITLEKTVYNPGVTAKGSRVTFILKTTNRSAVPAANVRVVDTIPAGLTFDPDTRHSSAFCSVVSGQVTCTVGSLAAGGVHSSVVSFLIPVTYQGNTCPASVSNIATVYTDTPETDLVNNTSARVSVAVPCPAVASSSSVASSVMSSSTMSSSSVQTQSLTDVSLQTTIYNPAVTQKGTRVTYILKVKNTSAVTAYNVRVVGTAPAGLTYDYSPQHSSLLLCWFVSNQVNCAVDTLAAGATQDFVVSFLIPKDYQNGTCPASITFKPTAYTHGSETNYVNNTAAITTSVPCPAVAATCGNKIVESTEQCDDGEENGKNGTCTTQCTPAACTDTDGGKNEFQKGIIRSGFGNVRGGEDVCASDGMSVYEGYCDGKIISSVRISCANGCENGACKKSASYTPSCTDSDGANIFTRGTLQTNAPDWNPLNTDKCMTQVSEGSYGHVDSCSGSNCFINEFICVGSTPDYHPLGESPIACPQGCANGACAPEPFKLGIAVQSIGSIDTAVKNSKNINLLRFETRASESKYIVLTHAEFTAASGSLLNGQNYTLWVDTNFDSVVDTILQGGVAAQAGTVRFDNMAVGGSLVIPSEEAIIFEVHADIASSLVNNDLQLKFNTGASDYIGAEEADDRSSLAGIRTNGGCVAATCDITVTTTPSKNWLLANQGDLFVTRETTPIRSRQLLGGTLGDSVLQLKLRAENEDIDVTLLSIVNGGPSSSIERIELYRPGATTPFASATQAACSPTMGANVYCVTMQSSQLVIPKGQDVSVIARPRIKSDENGGRSGENIQLEVIKLIGNVEIAARGVTSSNTLADNNGNMTAEGEIFIGTAIPGPNTLSVAGANNHVVMSKIISITDVNPDSSTTNPAIPTGVYPVGQFRFDAAAHSNTMNGANKVRLTDIIFTVKASNVRLNANTFKLYNKANASVKSTCSLLDSSITDETMYVSCWDIRNAGVSTDVSSGGSMTLVVEAEITNPDVIGVLPSSLQVSLDSFSDINKTGMARNFSHIGWLDRDTVSTRFWWIEHGETEIFSTRYSN